MPKATTVRFTDEMFARLDQASARTGMPVNSIVIAACLEWMERHTQTPMEPRIGVQLPTTEGMRITVPPRWATIRRAVEQAVGKRPSTIYPFEQFTPSAQKLLTLAQTEALKAGFSYIGTEHMLLAAYGDADFQSAKILAALSVDEAAVRSALEKALGRKKRAVPTKIIPTSRVKKVIEQAFQLCGSMGDPRVSTGHMLLALATEGEGIAAHVLKDLGATRQRIEYQLSQLSEPEP
ncbi:MAG: ATP-dependent Clp protease ATP-binding subunit [Chloroflexi bacterium]|nr:MAG: ATP-dependent Clp protease ATP-binding subunit [Chloroflexota bacterium]